MRHRVDQPGAFGRRAGAAHAVRIVVQKQDDGNVGELRRQMQGDVGAVMHLDAGGRRLM